MLVGTVHLQDSASSEAMSAASREQEKPTLGEVVDQIGLGPAQVRASLLGGGVWLADGAELLLIGSVADTLARSWQLSRFLKGFVVTVVYTGVMVGNISSGPLGAHLGRRELVIASYTGIFIFSILSSTSSTIAVLLVWRFIVGWSIGIGQPAWMAIAAEITPSSWRIVTGGFSQTMFAFGELYAAFLLMNDDPSLKHLNWRRVIQLGAIPSLILMALAIPFLQQSPTYLQLKGCHAEAIKVLESMRRDNRASDVSVDFRLPLNPTSSSTEGMLDMLWKQGKTILGAKLILPTMVVSFTCFELNLLYYGCIYAFPQVLSDLVAEGAAQQLLVGALWEIPGVCIGIALGIMYLRKTGIKFYLTLAASVTLLFIIGGNNRNRHWAFDIALYAGYYGIKLSPNIGFVLVYQVANEIYPAEARTLGCGLCLACGRLAAMLGPLLFEGLFELTGTWLTFFLIMAGFAVFNLYVVDVIPAKLELQEARRKTVALELPSRWFDGQVPRQVNNIGPESCWHQFALLFGKVSTIELVRPNASVLVQLLVSYKDPEGAAALMEALTDRYLLYTKSGVPDDCYPVTLTPGDGYSLREYYCSASVPSLPPREVAQQEVRHERPAVGGQTTAAQAECTSLADTRQVSAEATGPPAAYVLRRCGKGPVPDALREPPESFSISAQKPRLVFGREDTCDAVLRHQYVSKVHGTFVLQDSPEALWQVAPQKRSCIEIRSRSAWAECCYSWTLLQTEFG
ncbi:svop [Symbiodinium necroappetens]|uniref:Svop protein n=1 Tax=Symbiodinium necroappetens TaxID=1628268 RepID=A0A812LIT1_9DINO|nr:svop [Symbiodinium necroappetens]